MNTPRPPPEPDRRKTSGLFLGADLEICPPPALPPTSPPLPVAKASSRPHPPVARSSTLRQPIRGEAVPRRADSTRIISIVAVCAAVLGLIALAMMHSGPAKIVRPPPAPMATSESAPPPTVAPVGTVVRPLPPPARPPTIPAEKNLVANAGFDQVDQGKPIGWQTQHYLGEGTWSVDPKGGRRGTAATRISSVTGADLSWFTKVAVKPNSTFLCKGWVRCENVGGPGRGALLNLHGSEFCSDTVTGTSGWRQVQFTFASRDRSEVQINCLFGGWGHATGTAWFDDLEVTELFSGK